MRNYGWVLFLIGYLCFAILMCKTAFGYDFCDTTASEETVEQKLEIKTDVPNYLKGAVIIVRQADGKESSVSAERFKVVPRKQQYIVQKTKQIEKEHCQTNVVRYEKVEKQKNRISLMAGRGPQEGLDRTNNGTTVDVSSRVGAIGGAQYQRLLTDKVSAGVQAQTNQSLLVNIGLDY